MIAEHEKLAKMSEAELHGLYHRVFSGVEGSLVLEHLRLACQVYVPSFDPNEANQPYTAVFNEGKRSVILHIETQLKPIQFEK